MTTRPLPSAVASQQCCAPETWCCSRATSAPARRPVLHADLYLLGGPREVDELGLFDRADAIVLVEWPERSDEVVERATIAIKLAIPPGGEGRNATIEFSDGRTF
jgi:tRNA A37 threonylcarbamoyladenosine biosynthesis protein TsaE